MANDGNGADIGGTDGTQPSAATRARASYIHSFGYHLAVKMLGESHVHDFVRRAFRSQQEDPLRNQFHCFRANWRSGARFPWQLQTVGADETGGQDEASIEQEALFADITFDFIVFSTETVEHGINDYCHVMKKECLGERSAHILPEGNTTEEPESVAVSVAIRVGALVAVPSARIRANSQHFAAKVAEETTDRGFDFDGYRYYYQRGNTELTLRDLDEYCRGIDIVLEEMHPADIARIVGDAFLDCKGTPWKVTERVVGDTVSSNFVPSTLEQQKKHLRWCLKLHHKALEADGLLPLSSDFLLDDSINSIEQCMLDMLLMQSSDGQSNCILIPKVEARILWNSVNSALLRALENSMNTLPRNISHKCAVAAAAASDPVRNRYIQKETPKKHPEKRKRESSSTMNKLYQPQEVALFARGKMTILGGGRKKKAKFTLGPA